MHANNYQFDIINQTDYSQAPKSRELFHNLYLRPSHTLDGQNYGTWQIVQPKGTNSYERGDKTAMDVLKIDLAKLQRDANLDQSIQDVEKIIDQLERAREQIVESKHPSNSVLTYLPPPLTVEDIPKLTITSQIQVLRQLPLPSYKIHSKAISTK